MAHKNFCKSRAKSLILSHTLAWNQNAINKFKCHLWARCSIEKGRTHIYIRKMQLAGRRAQTTTIYTRAAAIEALQALIALRIHIWETSRKKCITRAPLAYIQLLINARRSFMSISVILLALCWQMFPLWLRLFDQVLGVCAPAERGGRQVLTPRAAAAATGPVGVWAASQQHPSEPHPGWRHRAAAR